MGAALLKTGGLFVNVPGSLSGGGTDGPYKPELMMGICGSESSCK